MENKEFIAPSYGKIVTKVEHLSHTGKVGNLVVAWSLRLGVLSSQSSLRVHGSHWRQLVCLGIPNLLPKILEDSWKVAVLLLNIEAGKCCF